jgi:hypothetical protein
MPPRSLTLAIVAFWLAMVGLFVYGDVWPRLRPAEPLLFPVDVIDEAGQHREDTDFDVFKNGAEGYKAEVLWRYLPDDDSFESECKMGKLVTDSPEDPRAEGPAWVPQVHRLTMTRSTYRLTRNGEMKAIEVSTTYHLVSGADGKKQDIEVTARVLGEPRGGKFTPHLALTFPELEHGVQIGPFTLGDFEGDRESVPVLGRGIILNPLHPPRRFVNLVDNQHWQVTVIDPVAVLGLLAPLDAAKGGAFLEPGMAPGASVLEAHVSAGFQTLRWDNQDVPCRVIRCSGDGPVSPLTFWARQPDGTVLRQEVTVSGDSWTFVRRKLGAPMKNPPWMKKAQ